MRTVFAAPVLLILAACGETGTQEQEAATAAASADRIECAVDGATNFERICTIERMVGEEGLVLTVRSPGGAFRRLLVTTDGRGVVAADGAEPAVVSTSGDSLIEVRIAADRYRLPATIKAAVS